MKKNGILVSLFLAISLNVNANEIQYDWYVAGAFGKATYSANEEDFNLGYSNTYDNSFDNSHSAFKLVGGYQINQVFSAEVGFVRLGELSFSESFVEGGYNNIVSDITYGRNVEVSGIVANGVAQYPVTNNFLLFAKLGIFRWKADATTNYSQDLYYLVDDKFGGEPPFDQYKDSETASDDGIDAFVGLGISYLFERIEIRGEYEFYESDGDKIRVLSLGALYRF